MGRVFVLDPGFGSALGHHWVANSVLASALDRPILILADAKLPGDVMIENAIIERHFRVGIYRASAWRRAEHRRAKAGFWRGLRDRCRRWIFGVWRGEFYDADLARFLADKNIGAADHVIVHSANDLIVRPLTRLLSELPRHATPTLHFRLLNFSWKRDSTAYGHLVDLIQARRAILYAEMEVVRREMKTVFATEDVGMLRLALPVADVATDRVPRVRTGRKFQVLYFGSLRDEKGWQRVPNIAGLLSQAGGGGFRVIMHVGNPWALARRRTRAARAAIEAVGIELLPGYQSDRDLARLLSEADVVILPYWAQAYRLRGSGVGLDSIAHGVPMVVSAGCALGEFVAGGNGLEATGDDEFAAAIVKIKADYAHFAERAELARRASATWVADSLLPKRIAGDLE